MSVPRIVVVGAAAASSAVIERGSFSEFSHMAAILADGTILDARYDLVGGAPAGVQLRQAGYLDSEPHSAIFEAPSGVHYGDWEAALRSQLTKPYDSRGIEGFAVRIFTGSFTDPNYAAANSKAWFCDEFQAWAAVQSGDIPQPPPWYQFYAQTPAAALNLFIGAGWRLVSSKGL